MGVRIPYFALPPVSAVLSQRDLVIPVLDVFGEML